MDRLVSEAIIETLNSIDESTVESDIIKELIDHLVYEDNTTNTIDQYLLFLHRILLEDNEGLSVSDIDNYILYMKSIGYCICEQLKAHRLYENGILPYTLHSLSNNRIVLIRRSTFIKSLIEELNGKPTDSLFNINRNT